MEKKPFLGFQLFREEKEEEKKSKFGTLIFVVSPRPDEVHITCNCKGAYVHKVPL